jgi:hypothetical protein
VFVSVALILSYNSTILLFVLFFLYIIFAIKDVRKEKKEKDEIHRNTIAVLKKVIDEQNEWIPECAKKVNNFLRFKYQFTFTASTAPKTGPYDFTIDFFINNIYCGFQPLSIGQGKSDKYNAEVWSTASSTLIIEDYREKGLNSSIFKAVQKYQAFETAEKSFRKTNS